MNEMFKSLSTTVRSPVCLTVYLLTCYDGLIHSCIVVFFFCFGTYSQDENVTNIWKLKIQEIAPNITGTQNVWDINTEYTNSIMRQCDEHGDWKVVKKEELWRRWEEDEWTVYQRTLAQNVRITFWLWTRMKSFLPPIFFWWW